jgi:hypothetical protein
MVLAPWMMGLLGNDQSLAPNLGLLGTAAGGVDPVKAAMAQLASKAPGMSQTESQAPRLAQAPGHAPAAPPIPRQPLQRGRVPGDPGISPAGAAIMAGGAAAAQVPASYGTAAAIGKALEAGLPAYIATKGQRDQARMAMKKEGDYQDLLNKPETQAFFKKNPTALNFFKSMGAAGGMPALQKFIEKQSENTKLAKDEILVGPNGETLAKGKQSRQIEHGPNGELVEVGDEAGSPLVRMSGDKTEPLSPEAETLSQMTFGKGVKELNAAEGEKLNALWKQLKHAGSSSTVINPAEKAAEVGTVNEVLDKLKTSQAGATQAAHGAQVAQRMLELLPNTITGSGAAFRAAFGNLLQTLGATPVDVEGLNKVESTQAFLNQAILLATPLVRQISSRPTQLEFVKAMEATGANMANQPKAREKVLRAMLGDLQQTVKDHEALVTRIQKSPRWADVKDDLDLLRIPGASADGSVETPQHAHWKQLAEQFKNDPAALKRLGPEPK